MHTVEQCTAPQAVQVSSSPTCLKDEPKQVPSMPRKDGPDANPLTSDTGKSKDLALQPQEPHAENHGMPHCNSDQKSGKGPAVIGLWSGITVNCARDTLKVHMWKLTLPALHEAVLILNFIRQVLPVLMNNSMVF